MKRKTTAVKMATRVNQIFISHLAGTPKHRMAYFCRRMRCFCGNSFYPAYKPKTAALMRVAPSVGDAWFHDERRDTLQVNQSGRNQGRGGVSRAESHDVLICGCGGDARALCCRARPECRPADIGPRHFGRLAGDQVS